MSDAGIIPRASRENQAAGKQPGLWQITLVERAMPQAIVGDLEERRYRVLRGDPGGFLGEYIGDEASQFPLVGEVIEPMADVLVVRAHGEPGVY